MKSKGNIIYFPIKKIYMIDMQIRGKKPKKIKEIIGLRFIRIAAKIMNLELEMEERRNIDIPPWWISKAGEQINGW